MSNILVVSGHTDIEHSNANKIILNKLKEAFPQAVFSILNQEYPDFAIDFEKEKTKLDAADLVVFDFPVYWYSYPSLLHRWIEIVFAHGYAYGSQGKALVGKKFAISFTSGGSREDNEGLFHRPIEEIVAKPLEETKALTGMVYLGSVYTGGYNPFAGDVEEQHKRAENHAERLIKLMKSNS